ncbi:MAG: PAS domain S-box protein, partial [Calditrichia bacterium]|nr:PAS domain S-box protein [Calditrichia bacterium]
LIGVNEETDIIGTIDVALKLKPNTKKIMAICDNTITGKNIKKLILEKLSKYKDEVEFFFTEEMDLKQIIDTSKKLTSDYAIIYVLYLRNKDGKTYDIRESVRKITNASSVPVYGLRDFYLGYGIAGGKLISGEYQGEMAGEMAVNILKGHKIEDIPVIYKSPNRYMFDNNVLKKYDIEISDLPDGSIVINTSETFSNKYKHVTIPALGGIFLLLIIILVLTNNIYKRKKAEYLLKQAHSNLKDEVEDKTKEISKTNAILNKEIEDRIVRERLLKHSEEKFRLLADNIPGVIYLCNNDENYTYIYLNKGISIITGYHKDEFLNYKISIKDLTHPDDIDKLFNKIKNINSKNRSFHHVYRLKHKNGEWRWVEEFGVGIFNKDKFEYLEGYFRDITDKKLAEEKLNENFERYQKLFNLSPAGILIEDMNGNILEVNEEACKQTGYAKEELIGRNINILALPGDENYVLKNINKIMSGQELTHTVKSLHKNKEIRYFELNESKISLGSGKDGIIVVSADITDRKKMEDALEKARALLQSSLEQISTGVQIADSEKAQIILANNEAGKILGQSVNNMYKISVDNQEYITWKHYTVDGKIIDNLNLPLTRTILKGETTQNLETLVKREDGTERWVLSNAAPVKNYNGEIIAGIAVFSDITEKKELEKEREKLIGDLKTALKEVKA